MKKSLFFPLAIWATACFASIPVYKDASAPVESRVADLLSRMTIEEKVGQLLSAGSPDTAAFDDAGNYVGVRDTAMLNRGVGSYWAAGGRRRDLAYRLRCRNGLQRYLLEKSASRHPGPELRGGPARVHGSRRDELSPGHRPGLHVGHVPGRAGFHGRGAGGFGHGHAPGALAGRGPGPRAEMGPHRGDLRRGSVSRVAHGRSRRVRIPGTGRQNVRPHRQAARGRDAQAFRGHGQPEGGRNIAPVNFSERIFRETHLRPFEAAVREAAARSVMASYNEWDCVPNHINRKLLTDILRGEWGFDGYVMSDGGA